MASRPSAVDISAVVRQVRNARNAVRHFGNQHGVVFAKREIQVFDLAT